MLALAIRQLGKFKVTNAVIAVSVVSTVQLAIRRNRQPPGARISRGQARSIEKCIYPSGEGKRAVRQNRKLPSPGTKIALINSK